MTEDLIFRFVGYDLLSGVMHNVSGSLSSLTALARGSSTSIADGFNRVGSAAMGIGTAMLAGSAGLIAGMAASAKAAADFQSKLVLLQTHAGATSADMKELGSYILKVAGQLGFNPDSLAEAVYHVQSSLTSLPPAMQNVKTDEEVLYRSAQLAAIGHADLEDSVNAVTKAFVAYQKDGYTAEQVTAIFNKTIGEGNMRLQELNQAFATGLLPVAEQAGIKLESVGAALATMTDLGIPATRAATYLRSAIIQMSIPTGPAVDALKAIGVASNDAKSQVDSFSKVLVKAGVNQTDVSKELQKTGSLGDTLTWLDKKLKASGLSAQDAGALMDKAFGGIRSGTGIVTLYNNLGGLVQKEKDAKDATAEWLHTWQTFVGGDPEFQLAQLTASWNSLVIVLGYSFLPVALKIIQTILPMVQKLGLWIATHQELVARLTEGLAVFLAIGGAITWVAGIISKIIGFLIPVIEFFVELGTQMVVAAEAASATGGAMAAAGDVLTGALGGPIGLAIAIIGALIGITILLVTHWEQVKQVAQMVWGWIGPYISAAVGGMIQLLSAEMAFILNVWRSHHAQFMAIVIAAWTVIKIWFIGSVLVIAAVIAILVLAVLTVIAIFGALAAGAAWVIGQIVALGGVIGGWVVQAWNAISRFFTNLIGWVYWAWNIFMQHPTFVLGFLVGYILIWIGNILVWIGDFFNWLGTTAHNAWTNFTNFATTELSKVPGVITRFMSQAPGVVKNWLSQTWNEAVNGARNIVNAITGEIGKLPNQIYNIGQDIVRGLRNGLFSLAGWLRSEAKEFVTGLVTGMREAIKSGSPSMLAAEVLGAPLSQGILHGMQMEQVNTQRGVNSLVSALPRGASNQAQGSVSTNVTANQNTEITLVLDDQVLAKAIDKRMARWFKKNRLY